MVPLGNSARRVLQLVTDTQSLEGFHSKRTSCICDIRKCRSEMRGLPPFGFDLQSSLDSLVCCLRNMLCQSFTLAHCHPRQNKTEYGTSLCYGCFVCLQIFCYILKMNHQLSSTKEMKDEEPTKSQ